MGGGTTNHLSRIGSLVRRVRGHTRTVYVRRHLCHRNGLGGHAGRYSAGIGGVVFSARASGILYIVSLSAIVPNFILSSVNSFVHAKTGANTRSSRGLSGIGIGVSVFGTCAHNCVRGIGSFLAPVRVGLLPCNNHLLACVRAIHFLASCVGNSACCGVHDPGRGLVHAGTRFGLLRDLRTRTSRVSTFVDR